MIRTLSIAAATAMLTLAPAVAQELGDARRGRAYAAVHCASCHAVEPDAAHSPRPGIAAFRVIADTPGMTSLALAVWLQSPHREMPNFIIPARDRDDVIAYILSLRTHRK
jgi:cytochrome c2